MLVLDVGVIFVKNPVWFCGEIVDINVSTLYPAERTQVNIIDLQK